MTRRRPRKPAFPSVGELAGTIRDLRRDALAILPMYARLHALGLDHPSGQTVRTSGSPNLREDGSVTGYVPELVVDSEHAEGRRDYARRIAKDVSEAATLLFKAQQSLERNVGPTPGYRQPETLGSDALVSLDEFTEARDNQWQRLKAGAE